MLSKKESLDEPFIYSYYIHSNICMRNTLSKLSETEKITQVVKKGGRNMLKKIMKIVMVLLLGIMISELPSVKTETNTMQTATSIHIGGNVTGKMENEKEETHWYKFTIPSDIGNKWIRITASNYLKNDIKVTLCDEYGAAKVTTSIDYNESDYLWTKVASSGTALSQKQQLVVGKTYYIKVETLSYRSGNGDYVLAISSEDDDCWGTFEKSTGIVVNKKTFGKLEYGSDIDCYTVTLPKNNLKHNLIVTSTNALNITVANADGVVIDSTYMDNNETNNSISLIGKGQKIYIKIERNITLWSGDNAEYTINLVSQKKKISTLKLTKVKKGSRKLIGKTIKNATITIRIGSKTYKCKSKKSGKFAIKLKKKLKKGQKIKITVVKTNYKKKTKSFRVR